MLVIITIDLTTTEILETKTTTILKIIDLVKKITNKVVNNSSTKDENDVNFHLFLYEDDIHNLAFFSH